MKNLNLRKVVGIVSAVALLLGVGVLGVAMAEKPLQKPVLPEEASERAKVTMEKVWEKKFDKPVEDVVFGEAEVTVQEAIATGVKGLEGRALREKIRIQYPKAIIEEEKFEELNLKFLDRKGNVKKEKKIQKVKIREWITELKDGKTISTPRERLVTIGYIKKSKSGKAIGVWEALDVDLDKGFPTKSKFTLFNENGDVVWETDELNGGEGGPSFEVSDDGETVIVYDFVFGGSVGGYLAFYNSKGLIKEITPLEGKRFDNGYVSFSGDGKFCAVVTSMPHQWLILFDNLGNELWRKELGGDRAYIGSVSPTGKYIIALAHSDKLRVNVTYCFDDKGNILWKEEKFGGNCVFSPDEKVVTLSTQGKKELNLMKSDTGEIIWTKSYEYDKAIDKYTGLNSIDISPEGEFTVFTIGVRGYYLADENLDFSNKPRKVFLVDKQGNTIWEHMVNSNVTANILDDKIFIKTDKEIHQYKINK